MVVLENITFTEGKQICSEVEYFPDETKLYVMGSDGKYQKEILTDGKERIQVSEIGDEKQSFLPGILLGIVITGAVLAVLLGWKYWNEKNRG